MDTAKKERVNLSVKPQQRMAETVCEGTTIPREDSGNEALPLRDSRVAGMKVER